MIRLLIWLLYKVAYHRRQDSGFHIWVVLSMTGYGCSSLIASISELTAVSLSNVDIC
jgi:hypothetical protein